jgi:hypothetical protein
MFIVNLAFSDMCMFTTQGLPVAINAFVQVPFLKNFFSSSLKNDLSVCPWQAFLEYSCLRVISGACHRVKYLSGSWPYQQTLG